MSEQVKETVMPSTAAEWNSVITAQAAKEGITLPTPEEVAAGGDPRPRNAQGQFITSPGNVSTKKDDTKHEHKDDEEVVYEQTMSIGGKDITFRGASSEEILRQVSAALLVAQPAPVAAKVETKPAISAEEMIEIGLALQSGDASAIDTYLDKSNFVDKYFEKKGVKLDDLKEAQKERVNTSTAKSWDEATAAWLAAAGNDYPGGEQNKKLMGYKLVELGLHDKPSAESLASAFEALKKDKMVFVPESTSQSQQTVVRKRANSTSMFGTGAESGTRQKTKTEVSITRAELAAMTPEQMASFYNDAMRQGVDPNSLVVK